MDVLRHFGLRVASGWGGRLTGAAQIRGYHDVGDCEVCNQGMPPAARLGVTMQEVHWVARASGQIVQPHAVDIREVALRRLRGFRSSRFSTKWHEPVYPTS